MSIANTVQSETVSPNLPEASTDLDSQIQLELKKLDKLTEINNLLSKIPGTIEEK